VRLSQIVFLFPPSPRQRSAPSLADSDKTLAVRDSGESHNHRRYCAPQLWARVGAIQGVAVAGSSLRRSVRHKCERTRDDPASAEVAGVPCLVA